MRVDMPAAGVSRVAPMVCACLLMLVAVGCAAQSQVRSAAALRASREAFSAEELPLIRELADRAYAIRKRGEAAEAAGNGVTAELHFQRASAAFAVAHAEAQLAAGRASALRVGDTSAAADRERAFRREREAREAELGTLEAQLIIAQQSNLPLAIQKADPARERARAIVLQTTREEAALFCAAAQALGAAPDQVAFATELGQLGTKPIAAALDVALALRDRCLTQLTLVRRHLQVQSAAASGGADAGALALPADKLFADLAATSRYVLRRDVRGPIVTVSLNGAGTGKLTDDASDQLRRLGQVAQNYPGVRLQLVPRLSGDTSKITAAATAELVRGGTLASAIASAPPAVNSSSLQAALDVVFITP
jgi:hypothetical protein